MKIELTRRDFLFGAVALPVVAALPPLPAPRPEPFLATLAAPGTLCLTRHGVPTACSVTQNLREGENTYVFENIPFGDYTGYQWTHLLGKVKKDDFKYPLTISNAGDRITITIMLRVT